MREQYGSHPSGSTASLFAKDGKPTIKRSPAKIIMRPHTHSRALRIKQCIHQSVAYDTVVIRKRVCS